MVKERQRLLVGKRGTVYYLFWWETVMVRELGVIAVGLEVALGHI